MAQPEFQIMTEPPWIPPEDLPPILPPPTPVKLEKVMELPVKSPTVVPPKRGPGRPRKDEGSTEHTKKVAPPKIEVPDFSEWEDFIATLVLRWAARAFVAVAFRGIDRYEVCSKDDLDDLELDDEELQAVARPFAHIVTKSQMNTKYGRAIMDSRDAIEASVVLFMWGNRVRRIGRKYRGKHERKEPANVDAVNVTNIGSGENLSGAPAFTATNGYRPGVGVGFN
jgi:hypothetical protein